MTMIRTRPPRRTPLAKPTYIPLNITSVDARWRWLWRRPLMGVLVGAGNIAPGGTDQFDIVQRILSDNIVGTQSLVHREYLGLCLDFDGSLNSLGWTGAPTTFDDDITLAAVVQTDVRDNSSRRIIGIGESVGGFHMELRRANSTGNIELTKDNVASIDTGITYAIDEPYFIIISYDKSSGDVNAVRRRLDTSEILTGTANNTQNAINNDGVYYIGAPTDQVNGLNGKVSMAVIVNDFFTMDQLEWWARDPFGPFRVVPGRVFYSVPAVGAFTMIADSGVYTLAGSPIAPKIKLPAASGVYSKVGSPILPKLVTPADSGAYSVVGSNISPAITVPVDSGVYSLVGSAVSPKITLPATSGVYALTGSAANLLRALILRANSGVYSVTGSDISPAIKMPASSGVYALVGSAALTKVSMPAVSGVYSLVGSDANLLRALIMLAESGVYSLTGSDANLLKGFIFIAESGVYSLTGSDILTKISLPAASGVYVITGSEADLIFGVAGGALIVPWLRRRRR